MSVFILFLILKMKLTIVLVPFGELPYKNVLNDLKKLVPNFLPAEVIETAPIPVPENAYVSERGQYKAQVFTKILAEKKKDKHSIYVGLADVDMYVEGLNFVFGLADPSEGVAIVSTYRLNPVYYGDVPHRALFVERTLKEVIHEVGHVIGLSHCPDPKCVMHFSNTIFDTDVKGPSFCKKCGQKIEKLFR